MTIFGYALASKRSGVAEKYQVSTLRSHGCKYVFTDSLEDGRDMRDRPGLKRLYCAPLRWDTVMFFDVTTLGPPHDLIRLMFAFIRRSVGLHTIHGKIVAPKDFTPNYAHYLGHMLDYGRKCVLLEREWIDAASSGVGSGTGSGQGFSERLPR